MTTGYVINIGDASAFQWVQFAYEFTLNGMSSGQIALDGVSSTYAAEFDVDKDIYIYKNGTLKFSGKTITQNALSSGGIVLSYVGIEVELNDQKAPMVGTALTRVWTSTSDNTIINTLVTSVSGWTTDVTNSSAITVPSFRVAATESVWDAVIRLISNNGKDISVDQANKKIYVYDELTRDDQFSFIEGKNAQNITRETSRSQAGKVLVYGKGDGANQINGSYGSGTPVHLVIDRNIITDDEADDRAESEYNKLNPDVKRYSFTATSPIGSLLIGDAGLLTNTSGNISEEVDIVRIKMTVSGNGSEKPMIEVTNPAFRLASKNNAETIVKTNRNYEQSQSAMQGSGNTLIWQRGINSKNGASLKMPFYIPSTFVEDQAGNIRVDTFTVDYDLDEFRSSVGTATTDAHDHSLTPGATDSHKHDATNSSTHPHGVPATTSVSSTIISDEGTDDDTSFTASVGWNNSVVSEAYSGDFSIMYIRVTVAADFSNTDFDVGIRIQDGGTTELYRFNMGASTTPSAYVIREVFAYDKFQSSSSTIDVDLYSSVANDYQVFLHVYGQEDGHTHAINTINTNGANANIIDSNKTPSLTGDSATTAANVNIGDDVSDAGSVNSTEVDIFLDFWSGSAWVNKHSIVNTGTTLDEDVDLTDGGTYPDAVGWWRVRIEPDSTDADYAQAIVKIKHNLDN